MLSILKWASQIIVLVIGVAAVLRSVEVKDDKRPFLDKLSSLSWWGKLSIAGFVVTFTLFVFADINQRNEIAELNQRLTTIHRTRELTGIEISFNASDEDWKKIETALDEIPRQDPEISYSDATIRAERGEDGWKINFDPVSRTKGSVKFRSVSATDPTAASFAAVMDMVSRPLWIKWAPNVTTEIEPRAKQHASAITISQQIITLTLRSPELKLRLNELNRKDFSVLVRADSQPAKLRFRSLDDEVTLDQAIDMKWKEDRGSGINAAEDFLKQTKPYVSGPHKLQVKLKI